MCFKHAATLLLVFLFVGMPVAFAQEDLENEIAQLRTQYQQLGARLEQLEKRLAANETEPVVTLDVREPLTPASPSEQREVLRVFGDARLRYEVNSPLGDDPARNRAVVRARLGASYQATENLYLAVRLVGGDRDDPNTSDVTLGAFDDDLDVGLDQVYGVYRLKGTQLYAGKFPQIFAGTDMVWDGDIALQGLGISFTTERLQPLGLDARMVHFLIDEDATGPDSSMSGVQLEARALLGNVSLAARSSYYDYDLSFLGSADEGDFRSNARNPDGTYLSDFNLLDGQLDIRWSPQFASAPFSARIHWVQNLGTELSADTGWRTELAYGALTSKGSWTLGYAYSEVEQDAVLAAFSNDNLPIATNYRNHGLVWQLALTEKLIFDLTAYQFKSLDTADGQPFQNWEQRLRANIAFSF